MKLTWQTVVVIVALTCGLMVAIWKNNPVAATILGLVSVALAAATNTKGGPPGSTPVLTDEAAAAKSSSVPSLGPPPADLWARAALFLTAPIAILGIVASNSLGCASVGKLLSEDKGAILAHLAECAYEHAFDGDEKAIIICGVERALVPEFLKLLAGAKAGRTSLAMTGVCQGDTTALMNPYRDAGGYDTGAALLLSRDAGLPKDAGRD